MDFCQPGPTTWLGHADKRSMDNQCQAAPRADTSTACHTPTEIDATAAWSTESVGSASRDGGRSARRFRRRSETETSHPIDTLWPDRADMRSAPCWCHRLATQTSAA